MLTLPQLSSSCLGFSPEVILMSCEVYSDHIGLGCRWTCVWSKRLFQATFLGGKKQVFHAELTIWGQAILVYGGSKTWTRNFVDLLDFETTK